MAGKHVMKVFSGNIFKLSRKLQQATGLLIQKHALKKRQFITSMSATHPSRPPACQRLPFLFPQPVSAVAPCPLKKKSIKLK